jgi:hypothetical protein
VAQSRYMKAIWLVAAVAAGVLVVLLLTEATPASAQRRIDYKRCGSQNHPGAGWYHVRAHNLSCREARHVARRFWRSGGDRHFERWWCHSHQIGDEVWRARCHRQAPHRFQRVKFIYGA